MLMCVLGKLKQLRIKPLIRSYKFHEKAIEWKLCVLERIYLIETTK